MLYVNYASHRGLLGAMWAVLVALQATICATGAALAWRLGPPAGARRRAWIAGSVLAAVCLVYSWLQVQG
jgi:hypothetical protein